MRVDPIIRQIVDRCHVGQSNLSIVRRVAIHQAVAQHRENIRLYQRVVGGRV